jgi:hypothetical protein
MSEEEFESPDFKEIYHEQWMLCAAENRKLVAALIEARELIVSWAAYASDYFQEKWDLAGDLATIDAILNETERLEDGN